MNLCKYADCLNNYDNYLEINIIQRLGPVLLGEKPIHVFCFSNTFHFRDAILKEFEYLFSDSENIRHTVIYAYNNSTKVVVVNIKNLHQMMSDNRTINYLTEYGYEDINDFTLLFELEEDLLDNLLKPIMGLLFGYPLKDVIGFIGHKSLRHTQTKGWKMYGDIRLSEAVYQHFEASEKAILEYFYSEGLSGIKERIAA